MQFEVTLLKPLKYLQTSLFPPGHATTQKPIFATRGFTGKKMVLLRISQAENTGNALGSCLFTYTTWAENIRSKPKWFTPWERCSTAPAGRPAAGISQLALSLVLVSLTTMGGEKKGGVWRQRKPVSDWSQQEFNAKHRANSWPEGKIYFTATLWPRLGFWKKPR